MLHFICSTDSFLPPSFPSWHSVLLQFLPLPRALLLCPSLSLLSPCLISPCTPPLSVSQGPAPQFSPPLPSLLFARFVYLFLSQFLPLEGQLGVTKVQ